MAATSNSTARKGSEVSGEGGYKKLTKGATKSPEDTPQRLEAEPGPTVYDGFGKRFSGRLRPGHTKPLMISD